MNERLLRLTGAVTAVYGFAVARRPELLARPSGIGGPDGSVPADVAACLRPLAFRDAACGLAMVLAPDASALRTATLLRIASDLGDAALLATALPKRRHRAMAVAVSLGWAALSAAGLLARPPADRGHAERRPEPHRPRRRRLRGAGPRRAAGNLSR
ncbi:hypothetical protein RMN57_34765 [Kitasatospora sp. CM 4170]|uniref:DUF4267 domain-containing protein n=1 Tax=Kitasatospora aburaviensis TaxID=67265 RepID=A0ABW1EVX2_9ACTN|nr:hypothetical protein [Kitasatospora sp. CM 4170]WNM49495.1 hypothetical protein RMN57_34765 [Kitasatospora sp. CM 4170]